MKSITQRLACSPTGGLVVLGATALALVSACGETPSSSSRAGASVTVATLSLQADDVGALQPTACADQGACAVADLPNPSGCDTVQLSMTADGLMSGECQRGDGTVPVTRFSQAGLLGCVISDAADGAECIDALVKTPFKIGVDGVVQPIDPSQVAADLAGLIQVQPAASCQNTAGDAADDAGVAPQPGLPADNPAAVASLFGSRTPPSDECLAKADDLFAEKINAVLAGVGSDLQYTPPETTEPAAATPTPLNALAALIRINVAQAVAISAYRCDQAGRDAAGAGVVGNDTQSSGSDSSSTAPATPPQSGSDTSGDGGDPQLVLYSGTTQGGLPVSPTMQVDGRPLCVQGATVAVGFFVGTAASDDGGGTVTCRCAAMTDAIVAELICSVPAECTEDSWAEALAIAQEHATSWLAETGRSAIAGSLPAGFGGAVPTGQAAGSDVSADHGSQTAGPQLRCIGSPLVLDLNGDGLRLSTVADGVRFDLGGRGGVQTAWVAADDDALLAIDRNHNGSIDDGTELFGEARSIAGMREGDGFAALARLDQPAFGGNGDGVIDARDRRFGQLLLWSDGNHDGVSQAGELRGLAAAGIASLPLSHDSARSVFGSSGNELGLRGTYVRADGTSGSMTDVYFLTR